MTDNRCIDRLGLRIHPALRAALNAAAESEFVPVSMYVKRAIVEKLRADGFYETHPKQPR